MMPNVLVCPGAMHGAQAGASLVINLTHAGVRTPVQ